MISQVTSDLELLEPEQRISWVWNSKFKMIAKLTATVFVIGPKCKIVLMIVCLAIKTP